MKYFVAFISAVFITAFVSFRRNNNIDSKIESGSVLEYVDMTQEGAPKWGTRFDATIYDAAKKNNIEPDVLYRLLNQESRFREDIISGKTRSKAGALGIAQFMPATAKQRLGSVEAALDPEKAIHGAAEYLADLYKRFGDWTKAVAAYNWGQGNVSRRGLAKAPAETRDYVSEILGVDLNG